VAHPRLHRRATRLFDGCQATLIWLAVLVFAAPGSDVQAVAVWAMVAVALAAAFVALCPTARRTGRNRRFEPSQPVRGPANPEEDLTMSYDHQEIGDFANERDAQDWAERNNLDVRDLHYRSRGSRGVTLSVRRSALGDSATSDLSFGRRTGFF
jgi:hypothetical protein